MCWKQIETIDIKQIEKKILEIVDSLIDSSKIETIGILTGEIGVSIFFIECYKYFKNESYLDRAFRIIKNVLNSLNLKKELYSFCNGISGFCWGLDYLRKQDFLTFDNGFTKSIDEQLFLIMINDMKAGKFDFLHNALGIGLYFLGKEEKFYFHYVEKLIDCISEKAEFEQNHCCRWASIKNTGEKAYNLSMSHGITSFVMFLEKCYKYGIRKEKTKYLRDCSIKFLLNNILVNSHYCFPDWVDGFNYKSKSRLAWCYGDLSIGYSLLHVSKYNKWKRLEGISSEVLYKTMKRKDLKLESVNDACFCHGTSGIAHIYNRAFNLTNDKKFEESSHFWLNKTLEIMINKDGIAGYKLFVHKQYGGSRNSLGILEGVAGVGLVLLAAISKIEPEWDECLLLS